MVNDNLQSYTNESTVKYYVNLNQAGFFGYEKKLVEKYFPSGSTVLDIGCGAGRTTVPLNNMGYMVTGIDYSYKMIDAAKAIGAALKNSISYSVQDARKIQYPDNSFDCALFSFNGLMLISGWEERNKALKEISRVLKPNGIFFFTTPFLDNKIKREYWLEKIKSYGKLLNQFSEQELISLGDEDVEEDDVSFQIHVPFIFEIKQQIENNGFDIIDSGRRLDIFSEEKLEDELDDNYFWIVKKSKCYREE